MLLLALLPAAAARADGELFAVRDQNPLIRGAYLPLPADFAVPAEATSFTAGIQWSNTVNIEQTSTEAMLVDAESIELDLTLARALGPWRLRATLPVLNRSAGILDSVIADWHDFFGLPKGQRPLVPKNAYAIDYANSAGLTVAAPSGTALGDLALEGGHVFLDSAGSRLALWAGLEAPTGSRAHLDGDGALDAALWLESGHDLGSRFALDARLGITRQGGRTPLPLERTVGFGTLALSWHASSRLDASVQFDAHGAAARGSDLKFLDHAVLMSFGGRYRLASGSLLEAAVVEDIEVDHSPDVTFHVGIRWPLGGPER